MGVLSITYISLVILSFLIYWLVPQKYKKYILIISCFLFYISYGFSKALYVILYIVYVFLLSKLNNNNVSLFISVLFSVIPLFISKYIYELPIIALSFVSFRGISYIVDNFKKKNEHNSFIDYFLYMSFFPTFLSGPIEKSSYFISEIRKDKHIEYSSFIEAILYVLYGVMVKIVIADRLCNIVDEIYGNYQIYTKYCLIGILIYPIYIYCDFSGYSYISYGISKLFGYNVTENFRQPYFSTSIKEFWNRWHISLNNWLTNYVYIPLGGSRKGIFKKYINIIIVFLLSGLWHGSTVNFIIWGLLNGILQVIGEITRGYREKIAKKYKLYGTFIRKIIGIILTYLQISITWVFFSRDVSNAFGIFGSLLEYRKIRLIDFINEIAVNTEYSIIEAIVLLVCLVIVFIADIYSYNKNVARSISRSNMFLRIFSITSLIVLIVLFGVYGPKYNPNNFIYFNF